MSEIDSLVVKVNLDGTGFQNGISNINRSMRLVQSEFQAASAKLGDFGNSTDVLKLKADSLAKQLDLQRQKVTALENAFKSSADSKGTDARATQDLEIKLNKARATMANMENNLKQTNNEISNQSKVWNKYSNEVESAKKSIFSIGDAIKSSLVFGAVYQGLGLVKQGFDDVIGGGIKFDSTMQQNQISFATMLGNAQKAKDFMNQITSMAAATPFETADLTKASRELLAFGVTSDKIIPTMQMLGDVSQGDKQRFDSLTLAFAQIQSAGKMQGGDLLQLVNAGFNPLQVISKETGKSMAELRKEMEKGAITSDMVSKAFQDATSKGGMFYNAMKAQSTTYEGLMSTLKDNLNTTFGTVMKPVFEWLTNTALPKAIDMTTKFTDALKQGGTIQAFKTIIPPGVVDGFVTFGNVVKDTFTFLSSHLSEVIAFAAAFATFKTLTTVVETFNVLKTAIQGVTIAEAALNLVMNLNPFVAIGTAVVAVGVLIYTHWDQIKSFLTSTWNTIKTTAESVWNGFTVFFSQIWEGIKNSVTTIWNQIVDVFKSVWNKISPVIQAGWTIIKTIFATEILVVYDLVTGQWDKIAGVFKAAWGKIGPIVSSLWNNVKSVFVNAWNGLKSIVLSNWEMTKSIFSSAGESIKSTVVSMWNAIIGFFKASPGRIISALSSLKQGLLNVWNTLKTDAIEMGHNIVEGLANGIKSWASHAVDAVKSLASDAINWAKKILDIHSPSKVFQEFGQFVSQGFALGIKQDSGKAVNATEAMVKAIQDAASKVGDELGLSLQIAQARMTYLDTTMKGSTGTNYLTQELANLTQQLTIQTDKVALLQAAYDKMRKTKGENAEETKQLLLQLLQEQNSYADIGNKIKDVQTSIKGHTQTTQDLIDKLSLQAQIEQATYDLTKSRMQNTAGQLQMLLSQYADQNNLLQIENQNAEALNQQYEQMKKEKGETADETKKLYLQLLQEEKAQADLSNQIYNTNQAIQDQKKQFRDLVQEAKDAESKYLNDLADAAKAYQQQISSTNDKLIGDIQSAWDNFYNQVDQKANALSNFTGLFDAFQPKEVSGTDLLNNLQGQVSAFEDWQKNIAELSKKGIDDGLLQQLRNMGPQAEPQIAALNHLTDDQLKQYVSLWQEKSNLARTEANNELEQQRIDTINKISNLRVQADQQLEQYRVDWEKKNAEIRKNTEDEINRIEQKYKDITGKSVQYGQSLVDGFIQGIQSRFGALEATLQSMAQLVDDYHPHSPAKKGPLKRLNEYGPGLVNTFANGIKANMPTLETVLNRITSLAIPGLGGIQSIAGTLSPSMFKPIMGGVGSSSTNNQFGGNTVNIYNPQNWDDIERELRRRGIRL